MKYLSVCSGIEAASVAWHPLGWSPVAYSEIDTFPRAVLAHHYPNTPNLGDMTQFKDWPDANIDLLVGGTPCQSFSVAGLRKGLDDPRGSLMLVYLAIALRYRPRWLVWENVPGVLSADGGRAFGSLLGGLAELGYGFAYTVLDAQYFGLAQRRQRVFVIGCLGDWRRAAAVLFERESLSGHPAPRREAWEEPAPCLGAGPVSGGRKYGTDADSVRSLVPSVSPALKARDGKGPSSDGDGDGACLVPILTHALRADGFDASEDGTGRGTPLVPIGFQSNAGSQGGDVHQDIAPTLRVQRAGGGGMPAVAAPLTRSMAKSIARAGKEVGVTNRIVQSMQVRRLTPRECERLQGFPDDYTLIPYRGKPAADGPRYKALGNSMAVPVMRWIGERIAAVDAIAAEAVA